MGPLTDRTYNYDLENGRSVKIKFAKSKYSNNGSLAILAYTEIDPGVWEMYDLVTVNIDDLLSPNHQYIHVNHWHEGFVDWLVKNRVGQLTEDSCQSGFVNYPLFEFNQNFLDSMSGEQIGSVWKKDKSLDLNLDDAFDEEFEKDYWEIDYCDTHPDYNPSLEDYIRYGLPEDKPDNIPDSVLRAMRESAPKNDLRYDPAFDEFMRRVQDPEWKPSEPIFDDIPY